MTRPSSTAPQPTFGFDHVVVAVRDLARAMEQFERIGFHVESGGHHPGFGTANALIQLGNGYIELLTVEDAGVASQAGIRRRELVEYLDQREGGLIGYAITCDSLEAVRLLGGRADPRLDVPPLDMTRTRPDGSTLRWRLLIPGGSTWCRPWPFLIDWVTSDGPSKPGALTPHPNGASAVDTLVVGATSIARVTAFYRENLGLGSRTLPPRDGAVRPRIAVDVGGCCVEFAELPRTAPPGPLSSTLDGEGVVEMRIRVASADAVRRLLATRSIPCSDNGAHRVDVQPDEAVGARVAFVE